MTRNGNTPSLSCAAVKRQLYRMYWLGYVTCHGFEPLKKATVHMYRERVFIMFEQINSRRLWLLLALAVILVLAGGLLASWTQTAGGTVRIEDVRFTGTDGTEMSALLYIPAGVTNKTPAPGILAVHGYINSRETQDGFSIEFARRGYVVLAIDQTGHCL